MTEELNRTASTANVTAGERFTPGPWKYGLSAGRGVLHVSSEADWICGEFCNEIAPMALHEAEANARLISAAPDMYEALEYAHRNGIDGTFWQMARAASAKAGGRS